MTPTQYLKYIEGTPGFIDWAGNRTLRQAWEECERGDWMLSLAEEQKVDIRKLTLVKAKCARLIQYLMKDSRSVDFLDVAERFGNGEATAEELKTAANAAKDAFTDAKAACAYAASNTAANIAAIAAIAAYAAYADAKVDDANVAAVVDSAAAYYAAYYAASTAFAASADDDSGDDSAETVCATVAGIIARQKVQRKCADICREILTEYMDFSDEIK